MAEPLNRKKNMRQGHRLNCTNFKNDIKTAIGNFDAADSLALITGLKNN